MFGFGARDACLLRYFLQGGCWFERGMRIGLFLYNMFGLRERERRVCTGLGVPTSCCDSCEALCWTGQQGVWSLRARDEFYCVILDYEYVCLFFVKEMCVLR